MRVKGGGKPRRSKNRVFKEAKGFWGGRRKLWKTVMQVVRRSHHQAFTGRRLKKRDFRRLWITRVSAAVRARGMTYSVFMGKMKKANVGLDRKTLADIAVKDPKAFDAIVAALK
ncbi:50S ribosomal protein L20 [bacterium]|nr:50S ribosomal protein L20 [bacterium]